MEFGYNLAEESVGLFVKHEMNVNEGIDRKNKNLDHLVTEMEDLERFLALVANRTDDSKRVDLTTAEEQSMVDQLRTKYELQHVFPEGKYCWVDKEVENVNRLVEQHIQGTLQRKINMTSEQMVLDQHEVSKALELFKSGLTRMNNLVDTINRHISQRS